MASDESSNTTSLAQMSPAELSALAKRLRNRAESVLLRHQPEQHRDLLTAATLSEGVARSNDLLVDVTDAEGNVSRSVPLLQAIGDDEVEYADCRHTLLAEGKCTTGGGAAPIYFLELVGNLVVIDMKGGTVVAVSGLPPGAGYLIRYLDAIAGGC
jgi:hypothetical protein